MERLFKSKSPNESWGHWYRRTWCGLFPTRGCRGNDKGHWR